MFAGLSMVSSGSESRRILEFAYLVSDSGNHACYSARIDLHVRKNTMSHIKARRESYSSRASKTTTTG
jgi:hypothetical protein